ncbi:aspartate aminotransferase family protein [Bacillus solimangrovi]|uniref:Glutamate-1-semialdehyde 2,1-aminomutase n=1 Tax=Bacillus solimangrovi TaxID=1305675 RepID=A0A1E5LEH8_9BACI|nr:aspartate aminotransferase family protein [Bacillus solimangrovi]OEH92475.1 glutamate-1-semialdehyde 2,1-aminomutase [Bacillus solimangrovi]
MENTSPALSTYKNRTKRSYEIMQEAKKVMPNGVTANIKSFSPYPIVMNNGTGATLTDVDGNKYVDYLLSYGCLMLGHGHPAIKQALIDQLDQDGTNLFGTPHQLEITFGKRIMSHYPSIESVRYTNSGTEATLLALRLASAYTGKNKIAKFEGHYHGGYDQMLFSINPSADEYGPEHTPQVVPESKGIDPHYQKQTLVLPFNDIENTEKLLRLHQNELAAVIIEPIQAGFIPATASFLKELRRITEELNILLIFDEVKTGFRIEIGGAQQLYKIKPDLTTLGKVIGGGFPIGIIGGKKEILMESAASFTADVFDSTTSTGSKAKDILFHSGTYNGHPSILSVGMAVLDVLEQEIERVQNTTNLLKQQLEELFIKKSIPMKAIGKGTIFSVILTEENEIHNYRDIQKTNLELRKKIDYGLLNEGIYTKPLNRYSLSTAHTDKEVELTIKAYDKVLSQL